MAGCEDALGSAENDGLQRQRCQLTTYGIDEQTLTGGKLPRCRYRALVDNVSLLKSRPRLGVAIKIMGWFQNIFGSTAKSTAAAEVANVDSPASTERRRVLNFLNLMASHGQKALVNSSQLGASWQAAFQRSELSEVLLRLQPNEVQALLDPGDFCTVTFNHDSHAHVFLTTVKASTLGDEGQVDVTLYVPDAVHTAGRRDLYRVPILQDLPMEAKITGPTGEVCAASPRDINTSGARLKLDAVNFDQFSIGDEIQITLELQETSVTQRADVRYADSSNHALGVHFLNTEDPIIEQNTRILVREAERCYLRRVNRLE